VFGSALEQCEQLVRAAGAVGYASRPILLFYAWSQAGRAVAAVSVATGNEQYRLTGHGLHVADLDQRPPLHRLTLIDKGNERKGAFTQLAAMLDSGSLPQGATLGQVWAAIPNLLCPPPDHHDTGWKPPLRVRGVEVRRTPGAERMTGFVASLPEWFTHRHLSTADVEDFFGSYPTLGRSEICPEEWMPLSSGRWPIPPSAVLRMPAEELEMARAWPVSDAPLSDDLLGPHFAWERTEPYLTQVDRWAYPTLGGADRQIQPFLAWWAALFALSMLARYEPASWARHLDVDASPDAVPLETMLDRALEACPLLVLNAIRQVIDEERGGFRLNGWTPDRAREANDRSAQPLGWYQGPTPINARDGLPTASL
jgi:hypothetical protein